MSNEKNNIENVIIIGNGFDLNLGLDTSFKSFVKQHHNLLKPLYKTDDFKFMNYVYNLSQEKRFIHDWYNVEKLLGDFCEANPNHNFQDEYKRIKQDLEIYLKDEQNLYPEFNKSTFSSLFFSFIGSENLSKTKIINFNYTDTVARLAYAVNKNIPKIIHIHGKLYDKNNPIIFGVNDKVKLDKNHSYIRKARFIKPELAISFSNLFSAKNIFFFGHSLGLTDHSYFDEFFVYLSSASNIQTENLIFFVHNNEAIDFLTHEINILTKLNLTKLNMKVKLRFIVVENNHQSFINAKEKIDEIMEVQIIS